jgi:hypothetical protein
MLCLGIDARKECVTATAPCNVDTPARSTPTQRFISAGAPRRVIVFAARLFNMLSH